MVSPRAPCRSEHGSRPPVAVVGAGNWLIFQDRLGPRVLERIAGRYGPEVEIFSAGSAGLALLDCLAGQQLMLIVDACALGGQPGEIHRAELDPDTLTATAAASTHQLGPLETLAVAKHLYPDQLPLRILLILVETQGIDDATEEEACRQVVSLLDTEIERWRSRQAQQADRACSTKTQELKLSFEGGCIGKETAT